MDVRQRKTRSPSGGVFEAVKNAEKRLEDALTVLWDDLPNWQRDNHYILSGYRPASGSFKKSFASLTYLHNETVNIYSHLIGAIIFSSIGVLLVKTLGPRYKTANKKDVLAFGCFFLGAFICLGMSATYHAITNHSHEVARLGNKLDYVGIVFLIAGSFVPSIYYGFYCEPMLQKVYWGMISTLGLGCATVSLFDKFRTPQWRPFRAGMFVAMGLSAVFPVLHGLKLFGIEGLQSRMGLTWMLLQGFLYISGAAIYAARVPERIWPGSFDIWGSSHQIFHVLVVLAAAAHLRGLLTAFDFNHSPLGPKC